jgi:hypothetical protein
MHPIQARPASAHPALADPALLAWAAALALLVGPGPEATRGGVGALAAVSQAFGSPPGGLDAASAAPARCELLDELPSTPAEAERPAPVGEEARAGVRATWDAFLQALLAADYQGAAALVHPGQRAAVGDGRSEYERLRAALLGDEGEEGPDPIAEMLRLEFEVLMEEAVGAVTEGGVPGGPEGPADAVTGAAGGAPGGTRDGATPDAPGPGLELVLLGMRIPDGAREGVLVWEARESGDPREVLLTRVLRVRWDGTRWALLLSWSAACTLGVEVPLPEPAPGTLTGEPGGDAEPQVHTFFTEVAVAVAEGSWKEVADRTDPRQWQWAEADRDERLSRRDAMDLAWRYADREEGEIRSARGRDLVAWRLEEDALPFLMTLSLGEEPRAHALVWGEGEDRDRGALVHQARLGNHTALEALPVSRVDGVLRLRLPTHLVPPPPPS